MFATTATLGVLVTPCIAAVHAGAASSDAAQYGALLNHERTSHGLRALVWRSDLTSVAYRWAAHMAATGQLGHNPDLATDVTDWQAVGENVGEGPSIPDLDAAFWSSAPHRSNILDPTYDSMGIGSVRRNGTIWISIVFRDTLHFASSWHPTYSSGRGAIAATTHHRAIVRVHRRKSAIVRHAPSGYLAHRAPLASMTADELDGLTRASGRPTDDRHQWESVAMCGATTVLTGSALRRPRVVATTARVSSARTALPV